MEAEAICKNEFAISKHVAEIPAIHSAPNATTLIPTSGGGCSASMLQAKANTVTFTWMAGPWGKSDQKKQTHLLKSPEEVEQMLQVNQKTFTLNRQGNPLSRWDTNVIAGNARMEDAHAVDILQLEDLPFLINQIEDEKDGFGALQAMAFWERWSKVKTRIRKDKDDGGAVDGHKDIVMASVFDGHMGTHILSELLSKTMHASIARAIGIWERDHQENKTGVNRIEGISQVITDTQVEFGLTVHRHTDTS
jgi:hypothetical protein